MNIARKNLIKNVIIGMSTALAVTGTIFTSIRKIEKVEVAEVKNDTQVVSETQIALEENTVTSRSSDETRTDKIEQENAETQETEKKVEEKVEAPVENKVEEKVETKVENKVEKKQEVAVKTETKNVENVQPTQTVTETPAKTETVQPAENTEVAEEVKTVAISDVKISRDMDLTVRTGLSRDDFIKLIAGVKYDTSGFFEENAGTIYDLCEQYSINEIFFCGLISAESGWNIASNHRRTHNYISLMYKGKLIQYNSLYEGLEVAAQKLHKNYLTPGGAFYHGKTLEGVHVCFCPSDTWVNLVYGRMKQIL